MRGLYEVDVKLVEPNARMQFDYKILEYLLCSDLNHLLKTKTIKTFVSEVTSRKKEEIAEQGTVLLARKNSNSLQLCGTLTTNFQVIQSFY